MATTITQPMTTQYTENIGKEEWWKQIALVIGFIKQYFTWII